MMYRYLVIKHIFRNIRRINEYINGRINQYINRSLRINEYIVTGKYIRDTQSVTTGTLVEVEM